MKKRLWRIIIAALVFIVALLINNIEVMYDIENLNVRPFIEKELMNSQYEVNNFLGELFITYKEPIK